ncbi:hypothetical protein MKW92_019390 [Papaver armeniacum]|nr:hypothetical protein MKW92_019390 [Papaver armeniacum]
MKIKYDYSLVFSFFDWARLRKDTTLEARSHELTYEFWRKPNLDINVSFSNFFEQLVYTFKDWGSDPLVFDIFFQALVDVGYFDEARNLFDKMLSYGVVISVGSCNCLLSRLSNNMSDDGGIETALKIFSEFPEMGVCWNTASYNIIIHALCRLDKVKEAQSLLLQMESKGCFPDVISYSTVIDGYRRAGEIERAFEVVEEMITKGLKPNPFTYNSIVVLLCKNGKAGEMKKAFSLHNKMVQMGLTPNIVTYTALVDGLCKRGEVETANELLQEMCGKGLQLNTCTFNSLINGLCKAGNIKQAIKMMEDMELAKLYPDIITYTTLIDAYCKAGEMPTIVTFNVLMNGFCMLGMLEDGKRLLNWMLEKGIKPNATTYNSLMKHNTYNILIKGHSKARNMKEACYLHGEMVGKGFSLRATSYNSFIKGLYKKKKFAEARKLFEEMRREGLAVDREIYNIFLDLNYDDGNVETTLELCDEAIEKSLVDKSTKDTDQT